MMIGHFSFLPFSHCLHLAVLDFTRHLIEVGADNDMVSSLVIFALQYVLVNHENWRYKFRCDRWKVTLKVCAFIASNAKSWIPQ